MISQRPSGKTRILVVDDNISLRETLQILLESQGYEAEIAGSAEEALGLLDRESAGVDHAGEPFDLILTDLLMPGLNGLQFIRRLRGSGMSVPVVMMTAYGTTATAAEAEKLGAWRYVTKPFDNEELLHAVRGALRARSKPAAAVFGELPSSFHELIGASAAMQEVYEVIQQVRDTRINCLIHGESGTGKERVARAIHYSGVRADRPFVAVNCGAISESLIESELFGYKKGSFTGATRDKDGYFLAANSGTLFLDEIGEMPLSTQVKVLRALAERHILQVGGTREIKVDVRIIAATNRNLEEEVAAGRFREDLYYRLNVIRIALPPLRERGDDIRLLAEHFAEAFAKEQGREISGIAPKTLEILGAYGWPGNVRELRNAMELAVAMERGHQLSPLALPRSLQATAFARESASLAQQLPPAEPWSLPPPELVAAPVRSTPRAERSTIQLPSSLAEEVDLAEILQDVERHYLQLALDAERGNKTKAAKRLGMSFRSFRYRCDKLGVG